MATLTQSRQGIEFRFKTGPLPLAGSVAVFQDGMACIDTTNAVVTKGSVSTSLIRVGKFLQDYDNSANTGTVNVMVILDKELVGQWYDNATGANAIVAANLFQEVYILDDHTVTLAASGASKAGRVWAIDSVKGVAICASNSGA